MLFAKTDRDLLLLLLLLLRWLCGLPGVAGSEQLERGVFNGVPAVLPQEHQQVRWDGYGTFFRLFFLPL